MEIVAYGVLADEETLLRRAFDRAFAGRHELRCLGMFSDRDSAPTAAGHEAVLSGVNDTLDAQVLRTVTDSGTRMIAQRSTGYSDIDLFAWAPTLPLEQLFPDSDLVSCMCRSCSTPHLGCTSVRRTGLFVGTLEASAPEQALVR